MSELDTSYGAATEPVPFDPANPDHHAAAAEYSAIARQRCPVGQSQPGVFVVSRFADVRGILLDPDRYSNRGNFQLERDPELPGGVSTITQIDPPAHTAMRRHLLTWFSPPTLRRQEPRVRAIIDDVIGSLRPGQEIDLFADVARPVASRTVYAYLGFPAEDWAQIKTWGDAVHDILPQPFNTAPEFALLVDYLMALAATRNAEPPTGADVLDTLLHSPPEGSPALAPHEAAVHVLQLVLAGTDTTASLLANLFYELLRDRANWERLVADRTLIGAAMEESLRHDSPLQMIMRTPNDDEAIAGCPVHSGDKLILSLQSANWDEAVWGADAADFNIDRPREQTHLAMGNGIHGCLGAPLARLQARLVVDEMLTRFPDTRLAPGFRWEIAEGVLTRRPRAVRVVL